MHSRSTAHLAVLLVIETFALLAQSQVCHFGNQDADEKALRSAPSCRSAYKLYNDCRWGSSADGYRASIARQKCEPLYAGKLTPQQKAVLSDKISFCAEQNGPGGGTLAISESATCSLGVIFAFATDIQRASEPLPRASFDCNLARTPIEKTICSNPQLGRAELLMSVAYKPFFNAVKGDDRTKLIASQRAWNSGTPVLCHLHNETPTQSTLSCLVNAYKQRAHQLNDCSTGLDIECIDAADAEQSKSR